MFVVNSSRQVKVHHGSVAVLCSSTLVYFPAPVTFKSIRMFNAESKSFILKKFNYLKLSFYAKGWGR
jgi:hypothetical protein